jgi:hypothetical protein
MPLINYVKTATNKRLLISESRCYSNWCTPCREHLINMTSTLPTPVHVRPAYAFSGQSPYMTTFYESSTDLNGSHCSREKGLPTQSTARRLTDPWVRTQFLSEANQWSTRLKLSFCWWQATSLTGPISPTCDRYGQYLLTEANPSVLNRHKRGLQPCKCRLANTTPQPSQPTVLHFSPNGPARSQFIHPNISNWNKEGTNTKSHEWDFFTRLLP